jgi:hypothetical protein
MNVPTAITMTRWDEETKDCSEDDRRFVVSRHERAIVGAARIPLQRAVI